MGVLLDAVVDAVLAVEVGEDVDDGVGELELQEVVEAEEAVQHGLDLR